MVHREVTIDGVTAELAGGFMQSGQAHLAITCTG